MRDGVLYRLAAALLLMIALASATAASAAPTDTPKDAAKDATSGASTGACSAPPPALGRFQASDGSPAPATPFLVDDGGERTLADFAGTALVVNLWATWCAPCVTEMPALNRLNAAVADDGIAVLPLSADREGARVVKAFYGANGIDTLPVMVDRMGRVARTLGVPGLPTTVLYDRTGQEVGRVIGIAEWDTPEAIAFLRACLAPAA